MSNIIYKLGNVRISGDPEASERARQRLVPRYYADCAFRRVLAKPYDYLTEETPLFVECGHPKFRKENFGECLGQCALAGQRYGRDTPSDIRGRKI